MGTPKSFADLYRDLKGSILQIGVDSIVSGCVSPDRLEIVKKQAAQRIGLEMLNAGLLETKEIEPPKEDRISYEIRGRRTYRTIGWAINPKSADVHARELVEAKRAGKLEVAKALREAAETLAITQGRWNIGVMVLEHAAEEIEVKSSS